MVDILKCKGQKCPIKNSCYRFIAKPDEFWQSYLVEIPYDYKKMNAKYIGK